MIMFKFSSYARKIISLFRNTCFTTYDPSLTGMFIIRY